MQRHHDLVERVGVAVGKLFDEVALRRWKLSDGRHRTSSPLPGRDNWERREIAGGQRIGREFIGDQQCATSFSPDLG
jgi:hypothetical protein